MTEKAHAVCQHCKAVHQIEYIRLGMQVLCTYCLSYTIPKIPEGGSIPVSGYSLTYSNFLELLKNAEPRDSISQFLDKSFSYTTATVNKDTFVLNKQGEAIDREWLHLKIQSEAKLAAELYNLAMTIWHS